MASPLARHACMSLCNSEIGHPRSEFSESGLNVIRNARIKLLSIGVWTLPYHFAVLHHKTYVLAHRDVVERVAGDRDDIGIEAWLELADFAGPTEQSRALDHIGLQNGERFHSVFDHQRHFAGLRAVR